MCVVDVCALVLLWVWGKGCKREKECMGCNLYERFVIVSVLHSVGLCTRKYSSA